MAVSYSSLPAKVLADHARTSDNYTWIQENWENLQRDFCNEFIAVADHKVVYNTSVYADFLNY